MIPRPAQYLLRFDDLCPTISPKRWERCRKLVDEFGIRPILAVIPDNQDGELERAPCDPSFWACLREMEAAGAAIAVHGYQHVCRSCAPNVLKLHRRTEFAGVDFGTQCDWIREGFDMLHDKGLNPRLWIAPRHGFDRNTFLALRELGVEHISDGFARIPYLRHGLMWIPQQLWSPMLKSGGLWTICTHPGTARSSEIEGLRSFLDGHAAEFTSFDRVLKEFPARPLAWRERLYERLALWRVQMRYRRRRWNHRRHRSGG